MPHLYWVSMNGEAKRDYPSSINYQSPWWQDYNLIEDHFARVSTAMTRGKADVRIAVVHPIESYWMHFGPMEQTAGIREQLDKEFLDITDWLLHGSIDFDFICESLLPEQCPQGGAPLQVGKMAYDVILVPHCETLRSTTLERLEAFADAGGRLIFAFDAPKYENALPSRRGYDLWQRCEHVQFGRETILQALDCERLVDIRTATGMRTNNLIHQLRRDGDERWLFVAHSRPDFNRHSPACQDVCITLQGEYNVMKYDTQTGDISPMAAACADGKTVVRTRLYDLQTLLLRYTKQAVPAAAAAAPSAKGKALAVPDRVDYQLEEPNVYLMDKAEFALDDGPFHPAMELLRAENVLRGQINWPLRDGAKVTQPWAVGPVPNEHTVRLRFTVHCAADIDNVKLALEDAHTVQICCNGVPVTAQPDGWFCDKSIGTVPLGTLHKGENIIQVSIPFGKRTCVEWHYLLGNFGVSVQGEYRELVPLQPKLGFDDVTRQGLAHYGSNITYSIPVTTTGG